jgi:hypothetical protein
MKHLGNKSLSAILAVIVNLVWWLEWVLGIVLIGMGAIAAHVRKGFALQVPVSYSPISIRQVYSVQNKGDFSVLNSNNGILSIHIEANWQNITMLLVGYGAMFAVIVIITYQFKKIMESFKQDQPFHQLNMLRVRYIALVLMGYSLAQWLFVIAVNYLLSSNFQFRHMDLTYDFNFSCLLMGVVLLAVEGIFKTGLLLEEDKQLTI